jgi:hypothetical protein
MGILENATAYLAAQLNTHASVTVVYSRNGTSMSIAATRGNTPYEASDADGIIHRTVRRDFLISADVFPFTQLPLDGDIITDNGDTYIVQSIPGELPYHWCDPGNVLMRVHTKKQ